LTEGGLVPKSYFSHEKGNTLAFKLQTANLLERISIAAMRDLVALNPSLYPIHATLSPSRDSLEVKIGSPADGAYHLTAQENELEIKLISPISGHNRYVFVPSASQQGVCGEGGDMLKGDWLSAVDSHDLIGILTRDMLRSCGGCLKVD